MTETRTIEKHVKGTSETLIYTPNSAHKDSKIIFVHGWGLSNKSYIEVIKNISEQSSLKVYAINLPGFGESSSLGSDTTLSSMTESLSSHINNLEPTTTRTHLVGHSLGSYLILKMLTETTIQKPTTTILFNPIGFHTKNPEYYLKFILSLLNEMRIFNIPKMQDGTLNLIKNPVNLSKLAKIALEANITESNLKQIQTEINIILGTQDQITPYCTETKLENLKNVQVQHVQGNHGFILREPFKTGQIVKKIIENSSI